MATTKESDNFQLQIKQQTFHSGEKALFSAALHIIDIYLAL